MMGTKERNFQPHSENISLEDLVPEDNFYRTLQEKLELSFVRELGSGSLCRLGPPERDPEVSSSACSRSCSMRVSVSRED